MHAFRFDHRLSVSRDVITLNQLRLARQRLKLAAGITLIELLVVISIIGLLCGILLPAVQMVREAGRRANCENNLRNQILALQTNHDLFLAFPYGKKVTNGLATSWYLDIMPQLEQDALNTQYNWKAPWDDANGNLQIANTTLPILRCPSSVVRYPGDCDYGGMAGSVITATDWSRAFLNGVMIESDVHLGRPIDYACITDGTSQTICIAENADRKAPFGRWIHSHNAFSHDNGGINANGPGEIFSMHRSGAFAAFADGSTRYLSAYIDPQVIGALCTRDFGEVIDGSAY